MSLNDDLTMQDPAEVSLACAKLLDSLQDHPPSIQVGAIVSLHRLLMEVFDLDVRQEIDRMERLMRNREELGWDKKFNAVRDYIKGELLHKT